LNTQYVYIYYHAYNSWNRPIGTFPTLIIKLNVLQELFPFKTQIFNKNNVFFTIIRARCTTLCDKVCHWLVTGRWFSPGPLVSSTYKTDRYDISEILLKVAFKTIAQSNKHPCEVYSIQHYVIKFVSHLWQVGGFLRALRFNSSTNKTDRHDIAEILLKVALNTKTLIACNSWNIPFTYFRLWFLNHSSYFLQDANFQWILHISSIICSISSEFAIW
jgi:hypothetical protein